MDGLDAPSFVELDPPTARGRSSSDEQTLAVAVFWLTRSPPCPHSDVITLCKGLLRLRQCVCCGDHVTTFLYLHHHAGKTSVGSGLAVMRTASLEPIRQDSNEALLAGAHLSRN